MIYSDVIDAIRSAVLFADISKTVYAIYAEDGGFIVKALNQASGFELEIIKP